MADSQTTSTSAVLVTLASNFVLFGCFILGFLILRVKFKRIYSPKSSFDLVPDEKKPEPLPLDPVSWIFILLTRPHSFIIQQCGLDGYFFLRFLFIFALIFTCGILMWIILLPVNATNGNNYKGLDQLSFANVKHKHRYYAHAFMSWIYYGGVIYVIYRELFYFTSLRNAVLSSPRYATKLSSRTVLFRCVPDTLLDEKQLYKMFNGVKRIYVSRNVRALSTKVRQREATALQLESAIHKLLITGLKLRKKAEKKGITVDNPDDINSWVPENKRPRLKTGGFFSKKEDAIPILRKRLADLDKDVIKLQKKYKKAIPKNSLFVEFEDQYTAQLALTSVTHHNPMRMSPAFIGYEPGDIDWGNMRLFWWEGIVRRAIAIAAITAVIIFWAIPVAFVGAVSNINNLTDKLPWLRWIQDIPKWILGVVTGLFPTLMLSLLLLVLPMFIRAMAKIAGCVSVQHVEEFTQTAYFAFLTVNGFLVTALASSATATVVEIIKEPTSAMSLLASNLPRSSNFYISYLCLQGLTLSSGALFQVVSLFLYYILGALLDKTLRKKWARFSGLGTMAWGTTFPLFTNLASITLIYSIISPMILLFAAFAFTIIFIAYRHNLTYCFVEGPDSRGIHYPKALFQVFTGLYLGQVCLLGLFAVGKGWGPIVLQAIGLGFTVFCHIHLKEAFDHLVKVVPLDCMKPLDGVSNTVSFVGETDFKRKYAEKKHGGATHEKLLGDDREDYEKIQDDIDGTENSDLLVPLMADRDFKTTNSKNKLIQFIRPDVYANFRHVKKIIPPQYNIEDDLPDDKHAFDQPVVSAAMPKLWIPKDPYGWSQTQIEECKGIVEVTDENSGFTKKGKPMYIDKSPI